MMLKKQTVWLLTMLSLLIVLSVYYMTSPGGDQVALVGNDEESKQEGTEKSDDDSIDTNISEGDVEVDANGNPISSTSTDELFTQLRMDLNDQRSKLKEQYESIMSSDSASVEEKNEAFEAMTRLDEIAYKESLLEKVIQSENSYTDVFVRAEDDVVHVTVKANEVTPTETVNIMQMVRDEFGEIPVDVKFQPTE
jgi:stage III sporulation protein AH